MIITIEIPQDQKESFIADFIRARPVPLNEHGDATMTLEEWLKVSAVDMINRVVVRGARIRYAESIDPFTPPNGIGSDNVDIEN